MDHVERPPEMKVQNETWAQCSRTTVGDRKITYKLQVVQQPVRARACGSGAKSSADRRPVDPPPIVELRIFEGENAENDITPSMAANYFLFATLEQARHIAHGRVPEERSRPVLTGTAVAGMTYLDRPTPAGYFLFPDLSVRNEGKYRLSFSLYEELKWEKDGDKRSPDDPESNQEAVQHVTHRLEVRSLAFHVYSAKKFPGLTSSTALSRSMADQGCRVRIRRDVRMRRREAKSGHRDWDDYEDNNAEARGRMSATPETPHYGSFIDHTGRQRSASVASHQSIHPLSRRTSLQDLTSYQQNFNAPMTPHHEQPQPSPYGQPPMQSFPSPSFVSNTQSMQPPPAYQSTPIATSAPSNYFQYPTALPPPQQQHQQQQHQQQQHQQHPQQMMPALNYEMQTHTPRQEFLPQPASDPSRRHSIGYPGSLPPAPTYSQLHSAQPLQAWNSPALYPPPQPLQPPSRPSMNTHLPPLNMDQKYIPASSPRSAMTSSSSYFPTDASHKRSYGNVFNDRHLNQPLRDGARPSFPSYGQSSSIVNGTGPDIVATDDEDNAEGDCEPGLAVRYKRADGSSVVRALPPHV